MAETKRKLSTAPLADTLDGTERLFAVQDGATKAVLTSQLAELAGVTKAAILAALGIDQFDVTADDITIGKDGKIIILPLSTPE